MGVHKSTKKAKDRLIISFAGLTLLTKELAQKFETTVAYNRHSESIGRKLSDADVNIFRTPVMIENEWKSSNARKHI